MNPFEAILVFINNLIGPALHFGSSNLALAMLKIVPGY